MFMMVDTTNRPSHAGQVVEARLTREPRASVLLHTKLEMRGWGRLGMGSVALVNEVGQYIGSHRFWV